MGGVDISALPIVESPDVTPLYTDYSNRRYAGHLGVSEPYEVVNAYSAKQITISGGALLRNSGTRGYIKVHSDARAENCLSQGLLVKSNGEAFGCQATEDIQASEAAVVDQCTAAGFIVVGPNPFRGRFVDAVACIRESTAGHGFLVLGHADIRIEAEDQIVFIAESAGLGVEVTGPDSTRIVRVSNGAIQTLRGAMGTPAVAEFLRRNADEPAYLHPDNTAALERYQSLIEDTSIPDEDAMLLSLALHANP